MERLANLSGQGKFSEYPPNCLQFKALCLAFYEDLKLPKAYEAYREIKNRPFTRKSTWSHPVVKLTATHLPADFLLIEQENEAYRKFEEAYDEVCKMVRQGHEIPETDEPKRIEAPRTKAVAQSHLQQIKRRLGV
jgi:hypothetical protein